MAGRIPYVIRGEIVEKTDSYLVVRFLGSNIFWDESDIAHEYMKLARTPTDEQFSVGDTVIAKVTASQWLTSEPPIVIMYQPDNIRYEDYRKWTVAEIKANEFEPSIDWKAGGQIISIVTLLILVVAVALLLGKLILTVKGVITPKKKK